MSVFGSIMGAIFGHAAPQAKTAATATAAVPGATSGASTSAAAPASAAPQTVDVAAIVDKAAAASGERLDWRSSIVDLMKALGLDSSLAARKQLAQELHYSGDPGNSAAMNVWLHQQVMAKLAANGGKLPSDIKA